MPTFMRCKNCGVKYYTCSSIPEKEEVSECEDCGGTVISLGPNEPDKDKSG